MANVNIDVQLKVIGDGIKAVEKSTKELVELEKQAKSVSGTFAQIGKTAAGVFAGNLLTKGFELAAGAAQSFVGVLSDSIAAASEQEDAINRLNVALAASGNFSKQASDDLNEFASSLQSTTKFADDAVLNASALIATLTGLSGQALKDATTATADLATALGKDLDSSAQLVAKALEGNVTALKRYGIEVKAGANDTETLKNVLGALNNQFGGAAAGAVKTFSGSLTSLKNVYSDVLEVIGEVVTQNPVVVATFNAIKTVLLGLGEALKANKTDLQQTLGSIITFSLSVATATVATFAALEQGIRGAVAIIIGAVNNLSGIFDGLLTAVSGRLDAGFEKINKTISDSGRAIDEALTTSSFDEIGKALATIQVSAESGFEALKNGATTAQAPVNALKEGVIELSAAERLRAEQGRAIASAANETAAAQYAASLEQERFFLEQGLATQEEFFLRQQELRQAQFDEEIAQLELAEQQKLITREQFAAAQYAQQQKLAQDTQKIEIAKTKYAQEQEKQRAANFKDTLGTIATLQSSGSQELFRIGQAAAIATATIDGFAAVQKALASAPPPFNFALAALVGVATGVQIAKIASTPPPGLATGLTEVPSGFEGDTFPAFLNSGERVVSAPQNQDLKEFIDDNANNRSLLEQIRDRLGGSTGNVVVNVGGRTIVDVLNDELAGGRVLNVG